MLLGLSECDNIIALSMRTLRSPNFKQPILLNVRKKKLLLGLIPAVHSIQPRLSVIVTVAEALKALKELVPLKDLR